MGETAQILALFSRARSRGERVCLATVVHVEGSSYRKPGARMIVTSGGERAGTISGGCLEAEVSRKAWWLTRNGPVVEQYQSSFDEDGGGLPWGLGCGGTVWVLLEQEPPEVLAALEASLRAGAPAVIVSRLGGAAHEPGAPGTAAVTRHPRSSASEGPSHLRGAIAEAFSAHRSLALDEALHPSGGDLPSYFVEYLAPPPHLTLFGAGDDAQPVCRFAEALGWRLTVADGRSHLLRPERFPAATELRLLHYDDRGSAPVVACGLNEGAAAISTVHAASATVMGTEQNSADGLPDETANIPAVDPGLAPTGPGLEFAVLLTHSYEQDRALLAALLPRTLDYLGVLGPRHRTRRLVEEVAPMLGLTPEECFARLHSPVGLDLGASDPAAIALAIIAELQATVTGREVAVRGPKERELLPGPQGSPRHAPMPEPSSSCAAIVLAAGASARLGQPKQLLCFRGEPLVRGAARLALAAGALPVLVIVSAENEANKACAAALDGLPVTVFVNPDAAEGMGSSLRLGMAALAGLQPEPWRVLLMVCDQPLLRPEHLLALLAAEAPGGIAAARYGDPPRLGVPAVFSREHFAALAAASGDEGARSLLRSGRAASVPVPEAAVDIDTPDDLRLLAQ